VLVTARAHGLDNEKRVLSVRYWTIPRPATLLTPQRLRSAGRCRSPAWIKPSGIGCFVGGLSRLADCPRQVEVNIRHSKQRPSQTTRCPTAHTEDRRHVRPILKTDRYRIRYNFPRILAPGRRFCVRIRGGRYDRRHKVRHPSSSQPRRRRSLSLEALYTVLYLGLAPTSTVPCLTSMR
jgi:hypothetical protein